MFHPLVAMIGGTVYDKYVDPTLLGRHQHISLLCNTTVTVSNNTMQPLKKTTL